MYIDDPRNYPYLVWYCTEEKGGFYWVGANNRVTVRRLVATFDEVTPGPVIVTSGGR